MENLLDLAIIKFELKLKGNFIAKVTLDWQGEFEVRYCRLTLRSDNSLWFQPPALREFGWTKCFGIPDPKKWKSFEKRVTLQFIQKCEQWVKEGVIDQEFLEKIKNSPVKETLTEKEMEEIP